MRELKFRVWDKLEKRFIYPDKGYQGHYVLTLGGEFYNLHNGSGGNEYIVLQYTGIMDKNGKDVYGWDIIKYDNHESSVVVKWTDEDHDHLGWVMRDLFTQYGPFEVIGSVLETPELL